MSNAYFYRCPRCLFPNTKPDLELEKGKQCGACNYTDYYKNIDWKKREADLMQRLAKYKKETKISDFSRYNFFYAKYLNSVNKKDYAIKVIDRTLNIYPRNLLLRQLKLDLNFKKKNNFKDNFDCRNISHNLAEIFYIVSNALSNQSIPSISNFYLNIARYLNKNFTSYDILYAENIHLINNLEKTKDIYLKIKSKGNIYNWYAAKQISSILKEQKKMAIWTI